MVEVEKILIRDNEGKIRASREVSKEGAPKLSFYDKKHRTRVQLGINQAPDSVLNSIFSMRMEPTVLA